MKASQLFVKALEEEGVEYIFGMPGEENLDFLEALSESSIQLILTRHEQAAGFMAATYGRLTGQPGVCLSTLGPGATNLVTAGAYANLGAMPMVMITGQKPIYKSKQGKFQIIDTVDMMTPITKYSKQIGSGERIPSYVREAFRIAQEERPGASHLELPEDVARDETQVSIIRASYSRRAIAEEKSVQKAAEAIRNAKNPLLLIGAAANRSRACHALGEFVNSTGVYFVSTQMGKGVVSEDCRFFVGNASLSDNDFVHRALKQADVIINVGHDVVEKPPFIMEDKNQVVIHVNFTSAEVDPVYFPQIEVIGDIATSIQLLGKELSSVFFGENDFYEKIKTSIQDHFKKCHDDTSYPIKIPSLVSRLRKCLSKNDIIALDNGLYKIWFARNYPAFEPNTVLLDNALATMGAGLPSAIMAALLRRDQKVMAICGDGGFMMNSAELETAVRLNLNLVVLVLQDKGLGMIKWKQEHMGFKDYGLDFKNPNFVEYAQSYGANGASASSLDDLDQLIKSGFDSGGVHLIEVAIDYSQDSYILNEELKDLSSKI